MDNPVPFLMKIMKKNSEIFPSFFISKSEKLQGNVEKKKSAAIEKIPTLKFIIGRSRGLGLGRFYLVE